MKIIESEKAKRITSLEISALKGMRHEAVKKIINRLVTQDQIPAVNSSKKHDFTRPARMKKR